MDPNILSYKAHRQPHYSWATRRVQCERKAVVGYSEHMEADENVTVKNLRVCEKVLTGLFKKNNGRTAKKMWE